MDGGTLNAVASWAAKIAPTKHTTPILGGVLLTAGDHLSCSATDYDLFGTVTCTGDAVFDEGQALVSARLLAAVTKLLGRTDEVDLVCEGPELVVTRRRAVWKLPTMDAEDFPATPDLGPELGRIPGEALRQALGRVLPAAADPAAADSLQMLTGVEITLADTLTLAATDRYRLAVAEVPWQPTPTGAPRTLVVPGALLATVLSTCSAGDVAIHGDDNMIGIAAGEHQVTGRQLDVAYVKWRAIIPDPAQMPTTVTADAATLLAAVRGVGVFTEKYAPILLEFSPDGAHISSSNSNGGSSDDIVELTGFDGDPVTVWCNPHYLADALNCLGTPVAVLHFSDRPGGPFLLRPGDADGAAVEGYRHVVMALKAPTARAAS